MSLTKLQVTPSVYFNWLAMINVVISPWLSSNLGITLRTLLIPPLQILRRKVSRIGNGENTSLTIFQRTSIFWGNSLEAKAFGTLSWNLEASLWRLAVKIRRCWWNNYKVSSGERECTSVISLNVSTIWLNYAVLTSLNIRWRFSMICVMNHEDSWS